MLKYLTQCRAGFFELSETFVDMNEILFLCGKCHPIAMFIEVYDSFLWK